MSLDERVRDACHRIEELYYETGGKCYLSFSGGKDSTVLLSLIKQCEEIYTIPEGGIPAVFSNTGIELGITVDFVKWARDNWYSNVQIIRPEVSFDWVIKNEGKPIKSKIKANNIRQYHYGNRSEALVERILTNSREGMGRLSKKHRISDKDLHMLHDDFRIKTSSKCCDLMKKKPFEKYVQENGIKGAMTGVRALEGGAREASVESRLKHGGKLCTWISHGIIMKAPIIDWTDEDLEE